MHDNIAMGIAGVIRRPEEATREEAKNARQASLMHEFIRDLPDGYNTQLGNGGASLSGGRKQAFVIMCTILETGRACAGKSLSTLPVSFG